MFIPEKNLGSRIHRLRLKQTCVCSEANSNSKLRKESFNETIHNDPVALLTYFPDPTLFR